MYIFCEYAACLVSVTFLGAVLFAVCVILIPLSEGTANVLERLRCGIAHEVRDLGRGLIVRDLCLRFRFQAGQGRVRGLAKEVAMFQIVDDEPRRPVTPSAGSRSGLAPQGTPGDPRG